MEIIKKNALDAWKESLREIIQKGKDFKDREDRVCREILNMAITVEIPEQSINLPINFMKNIDKWVYPSKEELESIMLDKNTSNLYKYTYGPRIFNFQSQKNQVEEFIIPLLKKDQDSRRALIVLYDPLNDSRIENKDIPSLALIYFKIKNKKLNITCFIRSNDMFIGWPANVYQIFTLQKLVAESLSVKTGSITTFSASAHVFEEHFEDVQELIKP